MHKTAFEDFGMDFQRLLPATLALALTVATPSMAFCSDLEAERRVERDIAYAPAPSDGAPRQRLDLYIPGNTRAPPLVVIWTGGSAWMRDNGKDTASQVAARLNAAGLAVAGVSIRSSDQARFPGQVHDVKAAIRFLRTHGAAYGISPDRIAIMGDSSGGWAAAMAATTSGAAAFDTSPADAGVSSAVNAAVTFYAPTAFLRMDAHALNDCREARHHVGWACHDDPTSPESQLMGCAIQLCAAQTATANPSAYVGSTTPPMLLFHGAADRLVPHHQSELLYEAMRKACREAYLVTLPRAGHGPFASFLDDGAHQAARMQYTTSECGASSVAVAPSWDMVTAFLWRHLGDESVPRLAGPADPPSSGRWR